MAGCPRGLAEPGAIAVPYATNELARVGAQRPPDHELTPGPCVARDVPAQGLSFRGISAISILSPEDSRQRIQKKLNTGLR